MTCANFRSWLLNASSTRYGSKAVAQTMTVSSSMTCPLCGRVSIGMLSTGSNAGCAALPCASASSALRAKLTPEPAVKPATTPSAASLAMNDLLMAYLLTRLRCWTMGQGYSHPAERQLNDSSETGVHYKFVGNC